QIDATGLVPTLRLLRDVRAARRGDGRGTRCRARVGARGDARAGLGAPFAPGRGPAGADDRAPAAALRFSHAGSAMRIARLTGAPPASEVPERRPGRDRRSGRVGVVVAPRSPQLHHALRAFTLGGFGYLLRELLGEGGDR